MLSLLYCEVINGCYKEEFRFTVVHCNCIVDYITNIYFHIFHTIPSPKVHNLITKQYKSRIRESKDVVEEGGFNG